MFRGHAVELTVALRLEQHRHRVAGGVALDLHAGEAALEQVVVLRDRHQVERRPAGALRGEPAVHHAQHPHRLVVGARIDLPREALEELVGTYVGVGGMSEATLEFGPEEGQARSLLLKQGGAMIPFARED